jgi:hypothetical protein
MSRHAYLLCIVLLGLAASLTLSCGSNPFGGPGRQILSLSVNPPTAEGPQAQFTATGTYTAPPVSVTPLPATWVAVDQNGIQTTAVSFNANGFAQCSTQAPGNYTVGAWATLLPGPPKSVCDIVSPFGNPCGDSVIGFALLTCP